MEMIVKIIMNNGKLVVSSRDVALMLDKEHSDVTKKIKEVLAVGEYSERDFVTDRGNIYKELMLTKDGFILLCMNYQGYNDFKRAYIQEFNRMERELNEISSKERLLIGLFSNDPTVVANSHKALVELETKPLVEKIEQDKPLVEFAEQVSTSTDCLLIREFCKVIADEKIFIGEKKLYQWLREKGFIMQNRTEPTQRAINQGLFEVLERTVKTAYGDKITLTTKVTGKGQIYFVEKLRKEFSK